MKIYLALPVLAMTVLGCSQPDQIDTPKKPKEKSSYGQAIDKAKAVSNASQERDKEVDDQANELEGE